MNAFVDFELWGDLTAGARVVGVFLEELLDFVFHYWIII